MEKEGVAWVEGVRRARAQKRRRGEDFVKEVIVLLKVHDGKVRWAGAISLGGRYEEVLQCITNDDDAA